jgi:hypothetical protein
MPADFRPHEYNRGGAARQGLMEKIFNPAIRFFGGGLLPGFEKNIVEKA